MHGQAHNFPDELESIDRDGHYYTTLKAALTAVTDAATLKRRQQPFTPREGVLQRSFLERQHYDSVTLSKLICAMLDDDVSACGGNRLLLDARHKFLTFFDVRSLPNAEMLGHQHMTPEHYRGHLRA